MYTHTYTPCTRSMQEEEDKETETTTWRTGQECCGILSAPTHHLHIPENMEQEGRSRSQKVVGKSAPETTSSYGGSWIQISSQYILKNTNTTSIWRNDAKSADYISVAIEWFCLFNVSNEKQLFFALFKGLLLDTF
jgi:hypothetical protein